MSTSLMIPLKVSLLGFQFMHSSVCHLLRHGPAGGHAHAHPHAHACMHMHTAMQANASLVPRAKVAKLVLKQAYPELA